MGHLAPAPPRVATPLPHPPSPHIVLVSNAPDLWTWIQHQVREAGHIGKGKLAKLGVNVDGISGAARGMPLPIFDETQWDHIHDEPRDNEWEDVGKRDRHDTGLHVLKKAGIVGKLIFPRRFLRVYIYTFLQIALV